MPQDSAPPPGGQDYLLGLRLSRQDFSVGPEGLITGAAELRLLCCTWADCMMALEGHLYALSAGSVIVLPPQAETRLLYGKQAQFWTLSWQGLGQDPLALHSQVARLRRGLQHLRLAEPERTGLFADLSRLSQLLASGQAGSKPAYARLYDLLASLVSEGRAAIQQAAAPTHAGAGLALDLKAYLDLNYTEPHSIGQLAERFFTSPAHLCRAFKAQVGRSIVSYLNDLRVARAAQLLREGRRCAQARGEAGFGSDQHFIQQFKLRMRLTPGRYRSQHHAHQTKA